MSVSAGVHQRWVCLELPDGRERGAGTAELIFEDRHWEMEGRGEGGRNKLCMS